MNETWEEKLERMQADGRITTGDADQVRTFSEFLKETAGLPKKGGTPEQVWARRVAYARHYPEDFKSAFPDLYHETVEHIMANDIYEAIQEYTNTDERSAQAAEWRVGISDLGYCSERTRRMLNQETPDDTDMLAAFIGTAIGDHAERAIVAKHPQMQRQLSVTLTLDGGTRTYRIPGHPDLADPRGLVLDGKTSYGLSLSPGFDASERQRRFQRHGYALALHQAGWFEVPLEEVQVGNFYIDRSAQDKWVEVTLEPFSHDVIDEMTEWLEETIYAYTQNVEAAKEPPREVCEKTCGFFAECRLYDSDVAGLFTDGHVLDAMTQYEQARTMEREARRLKDQARDVLLGMDGFGIVDGERFALRTTHVNETLIREYTRRGYDKIELKKVKQ